MKATGTRKIRVPVITITKIIRCKFGGQVFLLSVTFPAIANCALLTVNHFLINITDLVNLALGYKLSLGENYRLIADFLHTVCVM